MILVTPTFVVLTSRFLEINNIESVADCIVNIANPKIEPLNMGSSIEIGRENEIVFGMSRLNNLAKISTLKTRLKFKVTQI